MATEVWFRNPNSYVRELVECGESDIIWDRGYLVKRKIDPVKFANLHIPPTIDWRMLICGPQGTALLDRDHWMNNPKAVYPTWAYGEPQGILEDMIENPPGENMGFCFDDKLAPDERPVFGQEHRVIITDLPPAHTGPVKRFLQYLKEVQEENPNCIIHIHGIYSYALTFGMGFRAADYEPRTDAATKKLWAPFGKRVPLAEFKTKPKWCSMLGFHPEDLEIPRNRCMYNIKSVRWASENYDTVSDFQTAIRRKRGKPPRDQETNVDVPTASFVPAQVKVTSPPKSQLKEGDRFHCNSCSLQSRCTQFRVGAVCTLPGAEPTKLAKYFATRNADSILDGLSLIMATQANRAEQAMKDEAAEGEINPDVTKILKQLFDQGVTLAKLVDPNLRGGTKVQVNVGQGASASVQAGNPKTFIASVVREFEMQGIPRADITPAMIQGAIEGMKTPDLTARAIEGEVESRES